ncbi:MAG: sulfatase-like hydrolase/transferase [Verrucomicrobiota bacterium]
MRKTLLTLLSLTPLLFADPLLNSWITDLSGRYARIYPDNDAVTNLAPVTTWSRGSGTQSQPTYAGIHEIAANINDVYIRSTGLAFHIMGPWYGEGGGLFPNYPSNRNGHFLFPRIPNTNYSPKDGTGLGTIGLFVDGVSMFDSRDSFSYDTDEGQDEQPNSGMNISGDGIWNRDAYVNESVTFDPAFAHQAGNNHHYHANPPGLRHILGDSVTYDSDNHLFTESFNGNHSPILGWAADGLPVYGPYGYSDPTDASSPIRRMISGYQKRDGTNGSTDLTIATGNGPHPNNQNTGRTSLPAWAVRNPHIQISGSNDYGPPVSNDFPIGHYVEDYAYKGDLTGLKLYESIAIDGTFNPSTHFDLNEFNVRFCLTPDYPAGTWAYFTNIESDGTPVYPYNLAAYYFGEPTGSSVNGTPGGTQIIWEGGPEKDLELREIEVAKPSGDVTLTWTSVEGGIYAITRSNNLQTQPWDPVAQALGTNATTSVTDSGRANSDNKHFYQVTLNSIDPFDDTGFEYDNSIITQPTENNILLLILDDWGLDSSELYNTETGTNIQLANMPNLKALLYSNPNATPADTPDQGLLFTRGYAQPICSPTRATLLTGRQTYQHTVGNPTTDNVLPASELTFPEIMATEAPNYNLASFGKWHLGSGNTGPFDTGGWPNFSGTLNGGVQDYTIWERVKIENGILVDSGTAIADLITNGTYSSPYATSVQIDEAISFINAQGTDPWLVWMGFNAPHDPFHDPAPYVIPTAGYSTTGTADKDYYVKMLEALDHEIGRLLATVDLNKTNIIVIGDNGTPGQVDQAPAGGLAAAKGSLTEGGIHVPFFASGPDVLINGKSDKIVHVADLFATILDLTNINVSAATSGIDLHSTSILPIFQGNDMEDRCLIAEKFGLNATDGRSLIDDDWPNYKLISTQDVTDPADTPSYQMYEIGANGMESTTLTTPPNPGDAWEAAYNALVAKDQSLIPPTVAPPVTINIDLPSNAPPLINTNNDNIVYPQTITVGGIDATWDPGDITVNNVTTSAARVDENGNPDRFSIVAEFNESTSGLSPGTYPIIVTFPGSGGSSRTYTATNTHTIP